MNLFFSLAVILEIFICIFGQLILFRKQNLPNSESYCYSVILVFAIYSLSIQLFFLIKLHEFYYLFDVCMVTFFSLQIWKERKLLAKALEEFVQFCKSYKVIMSLLIINLSYLFLQVLLLPPNSYDSMTYHLARVLMFQEEGKLFLENFNYSPQATYPWGYNILSFLILRFYSDYGLAIFSFLSYTVIIVGTFGLVNNIFKNVYLSLICSCIMASLKEIVLLSTSTMNDIPMGTIAVVCFLAGYNFLHSLGYFHFYILIVSLLFGLSVKASFFGFLLPFLFLYILLLVRKYSFRDLSYKLRTVTRLKIVPLLLLIGLFFCLIVHWANNYTNYGNFLGESSFLIIHQNNDGLLGGIINSTRYVLQSLDLPRRFGGDLLTTVHNILLGDYRSVSAKRDIFNPFVDVSGSMLAPGESRSWYGPFGILILASIFYSLFKGRGYIRMMSFSLLAFFWIFSYAVIWMPWNGRFFSLFFAASGACVAFFIERYTANKYFRIPLLVASFMMMFYVSFFNINKPFMYIHDVVELPKKIFERETSYLSGKICQWSYYVINRNAYYDEHFTSSIVLNTFIHSVEPNSRVLLLARRESWTFPFLLKRSDLHITVARPNHISLAGKTYNINRQKDYLYLKGRFDYLLCSEVKLKEEIVNYLQKEEMLFYVYPEMYPDQIILYKFG